MSPDEQIEHERHIAAILRIRKPPDRFDSRLVIWLNSNVLTAIIGVLGTAVLGTWLSGVIQDRSKQNEMVRSARDARQQSQRLALDKVLSLDGAFLSTSDDLLTTVYNAYGERNRSKTDVPKIAAWKADVLAARDKADSDWRRSKRALGFELSDVFDRGVDKQWDAVLSATGSFEKCARDWYIANEEKTTALTADKICVAERSGVEAAIDDLTRTARTIQRKTLETAASAGTRSFWFGVSASEAR